MLEEQALSLQLTMSSGELPRSTLLLSPSFRSKETYETSKSMLNMYSTMILLESAFSGDTGVTQKHIPSMLINVITYGKIMNNIINISTGLVEIARGQL